MNYLTIILLFSFISCSYTHKSRVASKKYLEQLHQMNENIKYEEHKKIIEDSGIETISSFERKINNINYKFTSINIVSAINVTPGSVSNSNSRSSVYTHTSGGSSNYFDNFYIVFENDKLYKMGFLYEFNNSSDEKDNKLGKAIIEELK